MNPGTQGKHHVKMKGEIGVKFSASHGMPQIATIHHQEPRERHGRGCPSQSSKGNNPALDLSKTSSLQNCEIIHCSVLSQFMGFCGGSPRRIIRKEMVSQGRNSGKILAEWRMVQS